MYYQYTSTTKRVLTIYLLALICKYFFVLQLKWKHDYCNNDGIRLLMIFESGFKIFRIHIWDALRDLVQFVQFKKREKQPWKSVNFTKAAG